jgi:hypothetical protein
VPKLVVNRTGARCDSQSPHHTHRKDGYREQQRREQLPRGLPFLGGNYRLHVLASPFTARPSECTESIIAVWRLAREVEEGSDMRWQIAE